MSTRSSRASPITSTQNRQSLGFQIRRGLNGYLFILPTLIFVGYFLYLPAWTALTSSFTDWDGFNPRNFIGLDNFIRAFNDPVLRIAARNNLIWAVFQLIVSIVPPLVVALLIFHTRNKRAQYVYRTLFAAQVVIPLVVDILMWKFFYRQDGLINQVLGLVGLGEYKQLWISNPRIALFSLMFMGFPWIYAFNMLIFYAGLIGISNEVLEAAELDGSTGLHRVWSVELPLISPQFKLLFVLSVIGSLQNVVVPLVMTEGGPGNATMVPLLHMLNVAKKYSEFGYSSAISFVLFVVILILTVINNRFIRAEPYT